MSLSLPPTSLLFCVVNATTLSPSLSLFSSCWTKAKLVLNHCCFENNVDGVVDGDVAAAQTLQYLVGASAGQGPQDAREHSWLGSHSWL